MIDLEKKLIFTHPQKCGGTSIEKLINVYNVNTFFNFKKFKHASLTMHLDEIESMNLNVNSFFKFSIIRNPWARIVSHYNHNKYAEFYRFTRLKKPIPQFVTDATVLNFNDFVHKYKHSLNSRKKTIPFMFHKKNFFLDFVIRLEHIKEDLFTIKNDIGLDFDFEVPHMNNSNRFEYEKKHYTEYYDSYTKDLIESLFKWEIETFNYTFK